MSYLLIQRVGKSKKIMTTKLLQVVSCFSFSFLSYTKAAHTLIQSKDQCNDQYIGQPYILINESSLGNLLNTSRAGLPFVSANERSAVIPQIIICDRTATSLLHSLFIIYHDSNQIIVNKRQLISDSG